MDKMDRLSLAREKSALIRAGLAEAKPERTDLPYRQICLECVGGSAQEVATCTGVKCPLWEMRFGKPVASSQKRHPGLMDRQKVLARHREDE